MKYNFLKPLFIVSVVFTILGMQCDKFDYPSRTLQYDFTQKISLNPYYKQYYIGDTIWISLNTPSKILYDNKYAQLVGADSIFLRLQLNMTRLFGLSLWADPSSYCEFVAPGNLNPLLD